MAHTENQKKLLKILNEIFQLDQSDLDFGIYRIMNSKSAEINEFLENELITSVQKAFSDNDNSSVQKELEDAISQAKSLGADPETLPKVKELREKLANSSSSSNLENDVFSKLSNFFKRYYKDGDFVSLRRYKKDTYAIPYEGEEVKLHWANSDQYYIKSGEYFRDYSFVVNDKKIHFKLSDAETEQNNNKASTDKERRFVIQDETPCEIINDELYINFEYKAIGKEKQEKLNEEAITKALENIEDVEFLGVLNTLAPTEKNKNRTLFEKHLKSYTSRNSFDYFIHKDLGGFLNRELDFFIKNEMLHIDDILDSSIKYEEVMSKVKIFKEVSQKIIAFLTQLEELQKKLWEKKKFIIETNYCITLDKINEEYYEEIFACEAQKEEWKALFNVDITNVEDLKDEPYLVLDTKFFDAKFKYKFLSDIDNLDEEINGVLINSENFGALNLLQNKYAKQVNYVYIDPPYNTASTPILYKNEYKHSSWISLLDNRTKLAKNLMSDEAVKTIAIDDAEFINLAKLLEIQFNDYRHTKVTVVHNPKGSITKDFNRTHEYAIFLTPNNEKNSIARTLEKNDTPRKMRRWGENSLRIERRLSFYPIYVKNKKITRIGEVPSDDFHPKSKNIRVGDEVEIWPIDQNGIERRWNFGLDSIKENLSRIIIQNVDDQLDLFLSHELTVPKTVWSGGEFDAGTYGNTLLVDILGTKKFDFPKSINLVKRCINISSQHHKFPTILDYFSGSGTTGHAIINLNRQDDGKRKYILIEMGEYFNTVTKPRIQKVIYSDNWKDGKPQDKNGISQIFKYFKLESYEDSLNNLEFQKTKEQEEALGLYPEAKEDYLLNYALDVESEGSLLNVDAFKTPFDYKLKIATSSVGETKETNIDLIETFNYLLGLVVKRMELVKKYMIVEGSNLKGEKILIIWRDGQSSDELNEFFTKMDWSVYDREFDTIYVNGDNNLDKLRKDEDHFKVKLIEQEFKNLMFERN